MFPRREVEGFAALQSHPVEQQRDDDAGVARVHGGERADRLERTRERRPPGDLGTREGRHPFDQPRRLPRVAAAAVAEQPLDRVAERVVAGEPVAEEVERAGLWRAGRGIRLAQHLEHAVHLVERAEARERVERLAQGDDELGLVEGVAIVAVVRADRDPLCLFTGEAGSGLLGSRMRLQ
ncbi:hypothetical protein QFZ29_000930 [Agromyces albus]|nr:hypothetical protein [Agromyces albus]